MINADWFRRLKQSLEYALGFELFLLVGPGGYAEPGLTRLADELGHFGRPRWHALDRGGLDSLLGDAEFGVLHFVHGFEHLSKPAGRGIATRMNVNRQRLRELDAPVLMWIPAGFYEEFVRHAPDLLAWRSQVDSVSEADFEGVASEQVAGATDVSHAPPRVLISYLHESEDHDNRVLALAQRLRSDGIDAWMDRFETAPPQGWARWMEAEVQRAEFVLIVCTPTYRRHFEGGGASWPATLAAQLAKEGALDYESIVPVVFEDSSEDAIPLILRAATLHVVPGGYSDLVRRLSRLSAVRSAPLDTPPVFAGMPDSPDLTEQLAALERKRLEGYWTKEAAQELLTLRRELRSGISLQTGDILMKRYELVETIGRGGFAVVWKAHDHETNSIVAVKILHGDWSQDRSKIERFSAGARTMAALHHPAIVSILAPVVADGRHFFFVMPYLRGGDLRTAVKHGKFGRDKSLLACARAIEALIYAHERGMVHRDVKPGNILLDDKGRGLLTDFDLVWESDATRGTQTSAGMGTFVYAAPEQLSDAKRVDARADIYSAGMCILFAVLGEDPPPLAASTEPELVAGLPCSVGLRAAIAGAIAYRPDERTTTGAQLVAAIRESVASSTSANAGQDLWIAEGTDEFGRWATVRVGGVEQRMRWIEPGTFLMGSPESEVGRSDDEGPQHSVTLTRGFWLAETPCTQALWTEVLADNPSHFRAPERPVERVAWDDVQRFLDELTRRLPGPRFELPSEAQWEYACRAGTASARYAEVDISAWCWHNSGGSTHPVGQKQPNSWGLYDMLGNVWEWCADGPRVFDSEPVTDPRGLSRERRACRGGSWGDDPRFARSACRMSYDLDYRYGSVGFRLILLE